MGVQAHDKEQEVKDMLDCDEQDLKDHFHEFVDLSTRITDWELEGDVGDGGANDDMGVAVDFDDDDDNDNQHGAPPHACTVLSIRCILHAGHRAPKRCAARSTRGAVLGVRWASIDSTANAWATSMYACREVYDTCPRSPR
jgi:hypothetical protein